MNNQNSVLQLPINYFRYLEWHKHPKQQAARIRQSLSEGLFEIHEPRFEPCLDDIPMLAPNVSARAIGRYTLVSSEYGEVILDDHVTKVNYILQKIDNSSRINELFESAHIVNKVKADNKNILDVIGCLLGTAIIIPSTVNDIESSIPGASIGRFPNSPYHIIRAYWNNMANVRSELELSCFKDASNNSIEQLRRLHLISLMGSNLVSFYKPISQVSDESVWPGCFRTENVIISLPNEFVEYFKMVLFSLQIGQNDLFEFCWKNGRLEWGSGKILGDHMVYYPPSAPFTGQLEHISEMLANIPISVTDDNVTSAVSALAAFHQRFVQLHPFSCANQSLAMNIVNFYLKMWFDKFIPHLYLDMVALFLSTENYSRYFSRAVKFYSFEINEATSAYSNLQSRAIRINKNVQLMGVDCPLERGCETASDLLLLD